MAGFDVRKRPQNFFLVFIGVILFSVSLYTSVFIVFSGSSKLTAPVSSPRLQRRWRDLTELQGLITDLHNDLSEAVAERDDLEMQLRQILETEDGKHIARWTNIIQPMKSRLPPRLRNNKALLSCAHIDAIQAISKSAIGSSKTVHRALYGAKEVLVKSVNPDGKSMRNCMKTMTTSHCLAFVGYRLLREMFLLSDLQNENVVEVIGKCVRGPPEESADSFTGKNLLLVTEYGDPVSITQLQELPLKQKLEMSANIVDLLHFLKNSPLGSVRVEPFDLTQFRLFGDRLKLMHVDSVTTDEPLCATHSDCIVQTQIGWQPGCIDNVCKGHNSLVNLRDAYNNILTPVLLNSEGQSKKSVEGITAILNSLQSNGNASLVIVAEKLRNFSPAIDDNRQEENEEDTAADKMSLFNDLNTEVHQKNAAAQEAANSRNEKGDANNQIKHNIKQSVPYQVVEGADFPGMYDYTCRRTRAKWGCVLAVYGVDDAKQKCNVDPQCQAFVMVPHHSRVGWSTAFFKNGAHGYVKHKGTNVYIKQSTSQQQTIGKSADVQKPAGLSQKDDVFALKPTSKVVSQQRQPPINFVSHTGTSCPLDEVLTSQQDVRKNRESQLMKDMGWAERGMTDEKWQHLLSTGKLNAQDFMKITADSNGGGICVTVTGDQVQKGWLKVEPGTDSKKRHIAHIALFYLDRLLGLYQTVPTIGRRLSLQEMQRAHFSSISNEVKGRFAALLSPDGTLCGSLSAWINHDLQIKRKLSISPSTELAWAISPLTQEQKNDLEYLMLMWLGRLNQPPTQFFSAGGRMVHFDNYMAFLESAVDVLPYFNICQFPRHVVEILKYMQKNADRGCNLSEQLAMVLQNDPIHLTPDDFSKLAGSSLTFLDDEATKLLDIVQKCVDRFGDAIIFY